MPAFKNSDFFSALSRSLVGALPIDKLPPEAQAMGAELKKQVLENTKSTPKPEPEKSGAIETEGEEIEQDDNDEP